MNHIRIAAGTLILGALLAGCGDDKKDAMPAPTSTAAAQKPTTAAAANTTAPAAVAANDDIPSEADFEEQTEKDITAANLEAELDKLEKEIQ
jgi:uncharacterized lipoprotein YbaY